MNAGFEELDDDELLAVARIDFEKERFDDALLRLKQIIRHSGPTAVPAKAELARVHARLKLFGRAQAEFLEFLHENPNALTERFQLGMAYFDSGDGGKALEVWDAMMLQAPLHPPALFFSSVVHAQMGRLGIAVDRCRLITEKVEKDNLYFNRARDLLQKIEADPRWSAATPNPARAAAGPGTKH
jgi:tetratricopeptide (TPR) repeat protein